MNPNREAAKAKPSTLSDEAIVKFICGNMYAQYLRYGTVPTGLISTQSDLKCALSGRSVNNYVLGANFEAEQTRDKVAQVTAMVKGWQVNALWQIGPEANQSDICDLAVECGWIPGSTCIGMAIKLDEPLPDVPLPDGLTISTATDRESLRMWVGIYFSAAPQEYKDTVTDIMCELGYGPHMPWTYYIGYIDGKAMASSMVFIEKDVAGLYYIGTLPDYRKQGIGTAMTRYSLKQAQAQSNGLVVLQATDMGAKIYRHVGFQEYCKIRMLMLRA